MSNFAVAAPIADAAERFKALNAARSVLVEAPAGSGKTNLLTRRFLRLLAEVDDPAQIVAITFTNAAAAEMRHRILKELERASKAEPSQAGADDSMETLAARALARSRERGWNLTELSSQLRISTIDSFCRELALQQPLLNEFGGSLEIFDNPKDLYRRAARRTLEQIDRGADEVRAAIATLLMWRDNNWQEMETLLVEMLSKRDRWMQGFLFDRELDPDQLREKLEHPFARAVREQLEALIAMLDQVPHARQEALELARFACGNLDEPRFQSLAELIDFPAAPFEHSEALEEAREACVCLTDLILTKDGNFRAKVDKSVGFPADRKAEKTRHAALIADLTRVPGFDSALASIRDLPPARYTDEDWQIVRACFVLLRQAAAQLKVVFAEVGAVDYTEVAQIAMLVLRGEEGNPGEGALAVADDIRHLLVDEFQDTSRKQLELISRLIAAWPEPEGRTGFVVGDPMQSIYFFRDADAELFPQVRDNGLLIPGDAEPFRFDPAALRTNFRTDESLVAQLNTIFESIFAEDDGSGVRFTSAESPVTKGPKLVAAEPRFQLHCSFMPSSLNGRGNGQREQIADARKIAHDLQKEEIVALIRKHEARMNAAWRAGERYRIAILGQAHTALAPIAEALRDAGIPFRAIDLEGLKDRPEVMDALSIVRALLNPHDRVAWLGLLRAPWCGLSLSDLYTLVSADEAELQHRPVRELIEERADLLTEQGSGRARRVLQSIEASEAWRAAHPGTTLGTWMEETWLRLDGAACVDAAERANLELLWQCLDDLPEGDADALGLALDAALDNLKAQPDPRASGECGVQLMTIHKAKGLEFEVVIVPELQARPGRGKLEMLSWLERGLAEPDDNGDVTEFLVAPIQYKGADPGKAKKWVAAECKKREQQEARRLLYVAATRARDELHFFARPEYKLGADGARSLRDPQESLLKTAWPALKREVEQQFAAWIAADQPQSAELSAIAAGDNVPKPAVLKRLPADYAPPVPTGQKFAAQAVSGLSVEPFYKRHEGGLESRALGIAVHSVFEELARLRATQDWQSARKSAGNLKPRLIADARRAGLDRERAAQIAARALTISLDASSDPAAQWILSPHVEAASEVRWTGVDNGNLRVVQADRVFRAGFVPDVEGDSAWWIVDYKTAHAEGLDPDHVLSGLREIFAPQLEAYARVLRGLHGTDAVIRAGLYYPRMKKFDWWEA
jgi:ATP-dependent exoDNAse (exonuclease V) beta subunit